MCFSTNLNGLLPIQGQISLSQQQQAKKLSFRQAYGIRWSCATSVFHTFSQQRPSRHTEVTWLLSVHEHCLVWQIKLLGPQSNLGSSGGHRQIRSKKKMGVTEILIMRIEALTSDPSFTPMNLSRFLESFVFQLLRVLCALPKLHVQTLFCL